jgi:phage FluMu protein Com
MDRRIRDAERAGDYELAARLKCKSFGHLEYKIETVTIYEDYEKQQTVLQLGLGGDLKMGIRFDYRKIRDRTQEYVEHVIAGQAHEHLAKCPRCGVKNELTYHYTYSIIHELKRQQDEQLRNEPGPNPLGRQSLLERVQRSSPALQHERPRDPGKVG